ncbi:MAG: rhomboid family intramembrane serine protease [Solirubrobacteraceae bacterium]
MSAGGPDLFVICKSCGSEVSPYITECPYCGSRLRKRAPKLDRDQRVAEPGPRRRAPKPLLPRLRRDEIPGIRGDSTPYAAGALVGTGIVGCVLWQTAIQPDLVLYGTAGSQWWHVFTAAFAYDNLGYALIVLTAIGLFGWLLERRHGPVVVLILFLLGGVGGLAATAVIEPGAMQIGEMGALGAAIALAVSWAIPDLLSLGSGHEVEGDLLGAGAITLAVALMPLADARASWVSVGVGALAALAIGLPMAAAGRR